MQNSVMILRFVFYLFIFMQNTKLFTGLVLFLVGVVVGVLMSKFVPSNFAPASVVSAPAYELKYEAVGGGTYSCTPIAGTGEFDCKYSK